MPTNFRVTPRASPVGALLSMLGLGRVASFWGKVGSLASTHHGTALTQLPSQELTDSQELRQRELSQKELRQEELSQKELRQEELSHEELSQQELGVQELSLQELSSEELTHTKLSPGEPGQRDLGQQELGIRELSQGQANRSFPAESLRASPFRSSSFAMVTFILVVISFMVDSLGTFKKYVLQLSGMISSFQVFNFQDAPSTSTSTTSSRSIVYLRNFMFMILVVLGEGELGKEACHPHFHRQLPQGHLGHQEPQPWDLELATCFANLSFRTEELEKNIEDRHLKLSLERKELEKKKADKPFKLSGGQQEFEEQLAILKWLQELGKKRAVPASNGRCPLRASDPQLCRCQCDHDFAQLRRELAECLGIPRKTGTQNEKTFADQLCKLN